MNDFAWMSLALEQARLAYQIDEVPVGAVLVQNDSVIGHGYNQTIGLHDPSAHAEMIALRQAAVHTQNYRLPHTTLYVTLEPCLMCMGAIVHARVERVVIGTLDPKTGAAISCERHRDKSYLNHEVEIEYGIMADECATLLRQFFREKRG